MKTIKIIHKGNFLLIVLIAICIVSIATGCGDKGTTDIINSIINNTRETSEISGDAIDTSTEYQESNSIEDISSDNDNRDISTASESENTASGETTTKKQETTSKKPVITTKEPETTTKRAETTTKKTTTTTKKPETTSKNNTQNEETTSKPTPEKVNVNKTSASGKLTQSTNGIIVDYSNAATDGYICVKNQGNPTAVTVVMVTDKSGATCNYFINKNGDYETILLGKGSGTYTIKVLEQKSNGKYTSKCSISVSAKTTEKTFTYSSNNAIFTDTSAAVIKSYEICAGISSDGEKVKAIFNYIVNNIAYDTSKKDSGTSTRYPDADKTLSTKKGVCSDYACLFTVMCRAQRIPTKMLWGYIYPGSDGKTVYHAWNQVYYNGSWHFYDPTKNKTSVGNVTYTPSEFY